jgi:hypothetical protein
MSHLLKKNKNLLFVIRSFLFLLFLLLCFKTTISYSGNKLIYLLFSLISFYSIVFSFRKKSFFYENFFGTFLFLGFWLKFSVIYGYNLSFREGLKDNSLNDLLPKNYDDALIASGIAILGFITLGHIREFFINYPKKIEIKVNTELYKKYRLAIITSFLILIVGVCFSNSYFQIYQRGLVGQSYNFIISGFIKTSLLYSLALCCAFILYYDITTYKKVFLTIILLIFFESFLSSVSMLSRGMIFNSSALLFALYKLSNKINLNLNLNLLTFLKFFLILLTTFYISVITVNSLRVNKLDSITKSAKEVTKATNIAHDNQDESAFYRFYYLAIYRWVGIDAMILVTKDKKILGLDLFKESLKEKFDEKSPSFYESSFGIYPIDQHISYNSLKGNTLPGLVAFLYFLGSYIFLYIAMIFFCFVASTLEYLTFRASFNNLLASSVIGMVIAYRFAHFGYLPARSYLLFGSVMIIILMLFVIKYLNNLYKKSKDNLY